jgi:hypothetical protein
MSGEVERLEDLYPYLAGHQFMPSKSGICGWCGSLQSAHPPPPRVLFCEELPDGLLRASLIGLEGCTTSRWPVLMGMAWAISADFDIVTHTFLSLRTQEALL